MTAERKFVGGYQPLREKEVKSHNSMSGSVVEDRQSIQDSPTTVQGALCSVLSGSSGFGDSTKRANLCRNRIGIDGAGAGLAVTGTVMAVNSTLGEQSRGHQRRSLQRRLAHRSALRTKELDSLWTWMSITISSSKISPKSNDPALLLAWLRIEQPLIEKSGGSYERGSWPKFQRLSANAPDAARVIQ